MEETLLETLSETVNRSRRPVTGMPHAFEEEISRRHERLDADPGAVWNK